MKTKNAFEPINYLDVKQDGLTLLVGTLGKDNETSVTLTLEQLATNKELLEYLSYLSYKADTHEAINFIRMWLRLRQPAQKQEETRKLLQGNPQLQLLGSKDRISKVKQLLN